MEDRIGESADGIGKGMEEMEWEIAECRWNGQINGMGRQNGKIAEYKQNGKIAEYRRNGKKKWKRWKIEWENCRI